MLLFGLVALLAGALAGALIRVLVERAIQPMNASRSWAAECLIGFILGAALALASIKIQNGHDLATSSLGGALTAYCGACAAYQLAPGGKPGVRHLASSAIHFGTAAIATTLGYAGLLVIDTAVH